MATIKMTPTTGDTALSSVRNVCIVMIAPHSEDGHPAVSVVGDPPVDRPE